MNAGTLNHIFRLVWSDRCAAFVAVPETAAGRGKRSSTASGAMASVVLAAASVAGPAARAAPPLPTGGAVVQGHGVISQSGSTLTVQQSTSKLVTQWQTFDIAPGAKVEFIQPSASAVALNRVLGSDVSVIQGALKANGQVFLLNPNGVLFTPTARVDVGGLVASTLSLSDADFMAGRYTLDGDSAAAVQNAGSLRAASGGAVSLIAAKVINDGDIDAPAGAVNLAAGRTVTLDVGGSARLEVSRGALDTLVRNGGAIRADGGRVLLTAKAADALATSVVNHSGVIQARTLVSGQQGEVILLGDMAHGSLDASGRIDATAPGGGNGGFVETSAAHVNTDGIRVDAGAAAGLGGHWLIDPYNYTINAPAAAAIAGALNGGTSVTVTTQASNPTYGATGSGSGDITVASAIAKTSGGAATLTLAADRNIAVNAPISSTSGALNITLSSANNAASALGGVALTAGLTSNGGKIMIGGAGGSTTASQANGIGFALNSSTGTPAVSIGQNVTVSSGGGDIVINGHTTATTASYEAVKGGVYVMSGATVDTGGGNLLVTARSTGDAKEFAFGVEGNSGTVTTFRTGQTRGVLYFDLNNSGNQLGSLGLVNNGNQARIQFWAPSVAHMLFRLNGNNQAAQFTQSPPCNVGYPNCGTMVIPGGNSSYTSAGYNVVSPALLPIYVFTGSGTRAYDGTTSTAGIGAVSTLGGPGGFTAANLGPLVFSTPGKNAGTYTTLLSDAANPTSYQSGTYAVAYFNQGTYAVTPKVLNTFSATSKVYDGTTTAAVTSSGIVSGDAVSLLASGSFAQSGVGNGVSVNITGVSLGGADAGNYSLTGFSNINTTANITPAPLAVTATSQSKVYDGQAFGGGNGVTFSGFVNGESAAVLGGSLSYAGSAQGSVNAGTYAIAPQGYTASNYAITFLPGALTVTPATLTLAAGAATRLYGATNPTFSGTVTGFVGSDTAASATSGSLGFASAATPSFNVGTYAVNGSGLTANNGNYVFAQAPANATALTVTPAPLAVTANGTTKVYDATAFSGGAGVAYSGFVNGETASVLGGSLTYGGSAQGAVNAGTYAIVPQGLSSGNYAISYTPGTLAVTPATLTYAAGGASRTYGAANPAFSGSVTGFAGADTVASATAGSLAFSSAATPSSNVGTYAVNGSGLTANNGNYVFAQAPANSTALTVTPAPLAVAASGTTKVYDATAFSGGAGVAYSGFVNGETASVLGGSLTYGGSAQGAVNAGTYAIVPQGLSSGNYAISYTPGTLAVTPATLTYAAGSAGRTYGAANPAFSGSVTGFAGADTVASATAGSLTFSSAATPSSNVGTYAVNGSGLTANNGNYVFAQAPANATALTVTPAPLTVTAVDATKVYDGAAWAGGNGVTYQGFVNGEGSSALGGSLSFGGTAQGAVNAGTYTLLPQGLTSSNYMLSFVPGALAITPAQLQLAISGTLTGTSTKVYDGTTAATLTPANYTLTGFAGNDGAVVTQTAGTFADRHVGSGKAVTVSLTASDYTASGSTQLSNYLLPTSLSGNIGTITPAALTLAATPAQKVYDATVAASGAPLVTGLVAGDNVTGLAQAFGDKQAGSGKTVSVLPGWSLQDGNGGGNYVVTTVASQGGDIARRSGQAQTASSTTTYNAAVQSQGAASLTGVLAGDDVSVTGTAQGRNVGTYSSALTVGGADAANYDIALSNGSLTITPATLQVAAVADTRAYDGTTASNAAPVVSGLLGGDTVTSAVQRFDGKNAGQHTLQVVAVNVDDGNGGQNYAVAPSDASGAITPATLRLVASPVLLTQGGTTPALTGTVTGLVGGETLETATTGSLVFQTSASTGSAAGSYAVVGSGLTAVGGNYVFEQAPQNAIAFTVTAAPVTNIDALVKAPVAVPNFPDNARLSLPNQPGQLAVGSLNYVSLSSPGAASTVGPVVPPPSGMTSVAGNAGGSSPAGDTSRSPAADTAAGPFVVPQSGDGTTPTLATTAAPGNASAAGTAGDAGGTARPATAATAQDAGVGGGAREAITGTAAVAVRSTNGPLDVFVVDGGLNVDRAAVRRRPQDAAPRPAP